jgi:hypothetical protein
VASVTLARKLGIAARLAAQQVGRSRVASAVRHAARVTAGSFGRVLHQLWLEVTGFVFLAMAGIGCFPLSREWAKFAARRQGPGRLVIAVCFVLTFGYFGLSSFWRVKRKREN